MKITREAAIFELIEMIWADIVDDSPLGYIRYVLYHGVDGIKTMTNKEIEDRFFSERGQTISIEG